MSHSTLTPSLEQAEEIMTARVAAREKGVQPASIYRAIREGRLKALRSGNTILIARRDLDEWQPVGRGRHRGEPGPTEGPQLLDTEEAARQHQIEKNQALIELLRQWREEGDVEEQRRAFNELKEVLNEERKGYRLIYP